MSGARHRQKAGPGRGIPDLREAAGVQRGQQRQVEGAGNPELYRRRRQAARWRADAHGRVTSGALR